MSQRERNPSWRTRAITSGGRVVSVQRFRIEVIAGPDRGLRATSEGTEIGVGTAPGNQLLLTDPAVSRHHCVVEAAADGFRLRDLGSTNGTTLAGHRVERAFASAGAVLGVGESTLRFDCLEDSIDQPLSADDHFDGVLGGSPAMRRVFAALGRAADSDVTLLMTGETGTGKGALAEAVHRQSKRASGPFVVVDCGAIPESLIESELFGHERGAFTGADRLRIGAFEAATGGTIFLDELGELSLDMQPKLLRVLESRSVRRLGSTTQLPIDVRVVAATNRDLRQEVNAGSFRSDLFYRLNVLRLELPPLRERPGDIPQLAAHFYRLLSRDPDAAPPPELIARLLRQRWPGNVRELRGAIERAIVLGDPRAASPPANLDDDDFDFSLTYRDAKERGVAAWERRYIPELVRRYDGNLSRAARAVSMDRNHLRKLLKRYQDEST